MNFLLNMRISQKIMALVAGLAVGFIAIGIAYFIQINAQTQQAKLRTSLDNAQVSLVELSSMAGRVSDSKEAKAKADELIAILSKSSIVGNTTELKSVNDFLGQFAAVGTELQSSESSLQDLRATLKDAASVLSRVTGIPPAQYAQIRDREFAYRENPSVDNFEAVSRALDQVNAGGEALEGYRSNFESYAYALQNHAALVGRKAQVETALNGAITQLASLINDQTVAAQTQAGEQSQMIVAVFIVMVSVIVSATAIGVYFLYKSIVFPMTHIQSVIRRINRGKLKARVKMLENDELGDLGRAFNQLLDERIQNLEEQSLENERLNNSIISLIRAVGTIARKDLTIKVPVSADITGTVSDAINLLTSETAKTLSQVKNISAEVDKVADVLQNQSDIVVRVAEDERRQVIATAKALETSARAMNDIASKAGDADDLAKGAIDNTAAARSAVEQAVASIMAIRETISETEKRIKRLGDRSQEVSGIVSLINTIAERTHILALNASMHAASAGEAGKGFAVVADEVQRLAENAREATADISSMVNNIRVETSDTVTIMNKLISEVAAGTQTAELAGKRMNDTDKATTELVKLVGVMAESAARQAEMTNRVRDRAMIIRNFTEKTGSQIIQQKAYTERLKGHSASLVEQVSLFKLPDDGRRDANEPRLAKAAG